MLNIPISQIQGASTKQVLANLPTLFNKLRDNGYVVIKGAGCTGSKLVADELGEVIHTTEVKVDRRSQSLVTSNRALDFHTDHSRADYVMWLCIRQASNGGETILADANAAFLRLSPREHRILSSIQLYEHRVFSDDNESHALVTVTNNNRKFYYSFWLVDKSNLRHSQKEALARFHANLTACQIAEFKLKPDDALVVDNSWIFHGRRAIGDEQRFLRRFWVSRRKELEFHSFNHANAAVMKAIELQAK